MSVPNEPPPPYPGLGPEAQEKGGISAPAYAPQPGGYAPQPGQPGGYGPPPSGAPCPPGGYQPVTQQPAHHSTVVVSQPPIATTIIQQTFRENPVQTVCPSCQAQIVTSVDYETGTFTYLVCAIICLVGCDLGCCFIPFCVDSCKDVNHRCPNCSAVVGRWNRL